METLRKVLSVCVWALELSAPLGAGFRNLLQPPPFSHLYCPVSASLFSTQGASDSAKACALVLWVQSAMSDERAPFGNACSPGSRMQRGTQQA